MTIVCISDTHGVQPELPSGDILVHAGDLTENGSFDEVQAQITWLSSQTQKHKVVIAGNHDVLLDSSFLAAHPERDYPENAGRTAADLDWGNISYLQDESVIIDIALEDGPGVQKSRRVKIYGNPTTPQYVLSAFQAPRDDDRPWAGKVPNDTDILVAHGPPFQHLDGMLRAGCRHLADEIIRVRPRLVVCGHIHVARGREDVAFHEARQIYDSICAGDDGWLAVAYMVLLVAWAQTIGRVLSKRERIATIVNAAIVGGEKNEIQNPPIVVQI